MLGYARVSTGEQTTDGQLKALTDAGCVRVWTETASGALDRRPQLDQVLDHLRTGDTLVVVRLDRLGRSLRHLIDVVTGLAERGVHFRSLSEGFDTGTAGGRMIFQVLGALAEFERSIVRERTVAGLDVARARGRKGGRRPKMTPGRLATARQLYDAKTHTVAQIAGIIGVSRATVHRALAEEAAGQVSSSDDPATLQEFDSARRSFGR